MIDRKSWAILFSLSMVPYVLVAWAYKAMADGESSAFWWALALLIALRLCFAIVEALGGWLAWCLYGKELVTEKFLDYLRVSGFPPRTEDEGDALSYLYRIQSTPDLSEPIKHAAWEQERSLAIFDQQGIVIGMRMHAAADAAVKRYVPTTS